MQSLNQTCSGISQGQSTFYVNNPEIAPPPLADDTVATQLAEATEGVDLLGLGEKQERPKEELLPGFPATNTGSTKPISDVDEEGAN